MPIPHRLLIADEDPETRQRLLDTALDLGPEIAVSAATCPKELETLVVTERPDTVYIGLTRPDGAWTATLSRLQWAGRFVGAVVVVDAERSAPRLRHVINGLLAAEAETSRPAPRPRRRAVDRLAIPTAGRISIVRVDDITWIEGAGTYLRLHSGGKTHLLRESIQRLADRLDGRQFVRIHRSAIVNVDRVQSLEHESRGEYRVYLMDGTELKLTRSYRDRLPLLTGSPL